MNENLQYPQIQQIIKTGHVYRNLLNTPCVVQEKLDGCNFRIIYKNGEIIFGSRTNILHDDTFCNFGSIKENLLEKTEKLKEILNVEEFMVVGELIGYNKGKLIIPRIQYFEEKEVRFYALDILDITKNTYMNFVEVQELLKTAGFNTIPYENNTIKNLNFKSILFPDIDFVEGYVLRQDDKRYKIKSEQFITLENGEGSNTRKHKDNSVADFINNGAFFDYISKGIVPDAQKFHKDFCKEIIEEYLMEEDSDQENPDLGNKKKEHVKQKANEIFSKSYGVIRSNKNSIDNFDEIFGSYNLKKAKEEFMEYIQTI